MSTAEMTEAGDVTSLFVLGCKTKKTFPKPFRLALESNLEGREATSIPHDSLEAL
jgi:hypothetical protein